MQVVYSFLAVVAGFLAEIYTFQLVRIFGHLDWAERRLGPGSTYTVWRVAGIVAIIGGFWFMIHSIPQL